MTVALKKNIDLVIPVGITAYIAWYLTVKRKMDPKEIGIYSVLAFLLSLLVVSRITKYILFKNQTETNPTVQPDPFYNPAPLIDAIKEDIYCKLCFRDKDIYKELAALSDAKLVSAWKYWNDKYFTLSGESLYNAINGEVLGWELAPYWATLKNRFKTLNLI